MSFDAKEAREHAESRLRYRARKKIVYWVSDAADATRPWVVFLPGLTADHRLFAPQIEHFEGRANCLAWDAPAHGESRPFPLDFSLPELARWLGEIMKAEGASAPLLVGQSMGGYVAQVFDVLFPGRACGIVSVDSAPLGRDYYKRWELACLPFVTRMFYLYPWATLKKTSAEATPQLPRAAPLWTRFWRATRRGVLSALRPWVRHAGRGGEAMSTPRRARPLTLIVGELDRTGFVRRVQRAVVGAYGLARSLGRRRRP
ncbi:MAG: alpha/beta fold hydrolase [Adlercreutzia equolifaciens]